MLYYSAFSFSNPAHFPVVTACMFSFSVFPFFLPLNNRARCCGFVILSSSILITASVYTYDPMPRNCAIDLIQI